eukprot:Nitzschia sp. Nitz4//scaffold54_size114964//84269//85502//NITZ4_003861-RA/size114964-processed-gene-0.190-mRNA-1//-1//CDS//3329554381//9177//frame0
MVDTSTHRQLPAETVSPTKRKRRSSTMAVAASTESEAKKAKKHCRSALTTKGFQRHFAVHNYHDYSLTTSNQLDVDINLKASRGGVHNPFPAVLHNMMSESESRGFSDIVAWQPHGRAFLIHKPKEFVNDVLPKYFKHSKLSSFQRQLALYGFVRLTHDGPDRGAYYHELFLRERTFLCAKIQRTRVKGTWVRTSSSPESEPDFYTMDPVPPLSQVPQLQSAQNTAMEQSWDSDDTRFVSETDDYSNSSEFESSDTQVSLPTPIISSDMGLPTVGNVAALPPPASLPCGGEVCYSQPLPQPIPQQALPPFRGQDKVSTMMPPSFELLQPSIPKVVCGSAPYALPMQEDADLASFLYDVDLGAEFDLSRELIQHGFSNESTTRAV